MKIELFLDLAIYRRRSILILKNNWDNGAARIANKGEIIEDIPPTNSKTSKSP